MFSTKKTDSECDQVKGANIWLWLWDEASTKGSKNPIIIIEWEVGNFAIVCKVLMKVVKTSKNT